MPPLFLAHAAARHGLSLSRSPRPAVAAVHGVERGRTGTSAGRPRREDAVPQALDLRSGLKKGIEYS